MSSLRVAMVVLCALAAVPLWVVARAHVYAAPTVAPQVVSISFANRRPFGGFGVHVWPGEISATTLDEMRAVSVSAVRASLQPAIDDSDLPLRLATPDELLALIDKHDQSVPTRLAKSFSKILKDGHLRLHLIFWGYPKRWQAKSKVAGNYIPDMSFIENYANFIVASLRWLQRFDIVPDFIELTNEPHGWWNTLYTPDQYARLLATTSAAMDANGLAKIGIEGPGTDLESFARFLAPLQRDGLVRLLSAYSLHVYDRSSDLSQVAITLASARQSLERKPIFITEFSNASPVWTKPPWSDKPLFHDSRDAHSSRDFAVSAVADAIALLAQGSDTIFYWQLIDRPWDNTTFGLLDVGERQKPLSWAFRLAFGRLRGSEVAASSGAARNPVVCFAQGNNEGCVLANVGNLPTSILLSVTKPRAQRCSASINSFSRDVDAKANEEAINGSLSGTEGCRITVGLPPRTIARLNLK